MRPAPAKSSPWVLACAAAGLLAVLWCSHRAKHVVAATSETQNPWRQPLPSIEPQPANGPYAGHISAVEKPAAPLVSVEPCVGNPASFSTQIELGQLAAQHDLSLTPEQLKIFASVTNAVQAARHHYEASIAQMLPRRTNHLQMVVPMYSDVGDSLRNVYYGALRTQLGDEVATQIQHALGAELETMFGDFGASEQGFEVAVDHTAAGAEYTVNSTAVFWIAPTPTPTPAGVTNGAFAVHRETHLLPIEDPAGTTWGDFMRLFASQS